MPRARTPEISASCCQPVEKSVVILQATAEREIPADTAARWLQALASQTKLIEATELITRLEALEIANDSHLEARVTKLEQASQQWQPLVVVMKSGQTKEQALAPVGITPAKLHSSRLIIFVSRFGNDR